MATQIAHEEARFRRIYARQWLDRWYDEYDAGIHATGREAPFASGATILAPQKMGRRPFHCLSTGETWAALLLLFHPSVWEVHEQRILYPVPRKHFLEGHPRGAGFHWPQLRGTLDVAERLNLLPHIRSIRIRGDREGEYRSVPVFWLGDQLVFLQDETGPYVVNWSIKDTSDAFGKPGPRRDGKMPTEKELEHARARRQVEIVYYEDARIPTREISRDQINPTLFYNLRDLFLSEAVPIAANEEKTARAIEMFQQEVGSEEPAYLLANTVSQRLSITPEDAKYILSQAIWARRIRVNLFQRILLDKPLRPEREDPVQRYADWFRR